MKKAIRRTTVWVIAPVTLLFVALFALTAAIRYPDPVAAYQLAMSIPSEQPGIMKVHQIAASKTPHSWAVDQNQEALPEEILFEGTGYDTRQLLESTATNAFLVIRGGQITYEWYAPGWEPEKLINTMSMGKTMVGIAAGILIAEGKLREKDSVTTHLPQFAEIDRLEEVQVKHLLDMQSCIGVAEDYPSGPEGWGAPIAQMFATTDIEFVLDNNLSVACDPGSEEYEYRSVNTQLLGMIVTEVAGVSLSEFFAQRVWQPIGASVDASWSVDRIGGYEKSYCCFNASARDLGLVGAMFLAGGKVPFGANAGRPVISEDWYARMTTPANTWFGGYGSKTFGANMWHEPGDQLLSQGYRGQFIWMNRETDTVIVKLSDDLENLYYDQIIALLDQVSFNTK